MLLLGFESDVEGFGRVATLGSKFVRLSSILCCEKYYYKTVTEKRIGIL